MSEAAQTPITVWLELEQEDATHLWYLLSERPHSESWSGRICVALAPLLGFQIPDHMRKP